jgi:hypothetical protein
MTEEKWRDGTDPQLLLNFLHGKVSNRKWQLWVCGFDCWPTGGFTPQQADWLEAIAIAADLAPFPTSYQFCVSIWEQVCSRTSNVATAESQATRSLISHTQCVFGNPFRPSSIDPYWRTSTVVELAEGIYEGRNFDDMPILSDALLDAGCDSTDILAHCRLQDIGQSIPDITIPSRRNGPHCRGCWVVDLILGLN